MTLRFAPMPLRLALLAVLEIAPLAFAQSAAFDVATIKPSAGNLAGEGSGRSRIEHSPNSLTMRNVDLAEMVEWAYQALPHQISDESALKERRYDIRAKIADPVPVSQLRLMLRELLTARFKAAIRREPKPALVYELMVNKDGPKLPADKSDVLAGSASRESLPRIVDGGFVFSNVTIAELAGQLSQLRGMDRPVVDRTGILGVYDIKLKSAAAAILQPDGPSLSTLIREQLGLKLVPAKSPIEAFVITHAEKPSEN